MTENNTDDRDVTPDAPAGVSTQVMDPPDLYRDPAEAATIAGERESVRAERERLAAERAARREARLAALNPTPQPDAAALAAAAAAAASAPAEAPPAQPQQVVVTRRSTDRFAGSLGLFLLRVAVAAIVGIHGVGRLLNPQPTADILANTLLPSPYMLALVVAAAEVAVAIALVFGLLTRLAGLGVVLIYAGALVFVLWGPWNPFQPGLTGFTGELELLLAAVGLLLLLVGAGGWSVDRAFRARRDADKQARQAA